MTTMPRCKASAISPADQIVGIAQAQLALRVPRREPPFADHRQQRIGGANLGTDMRAEVGPRRDVVDIHEDLLGAELRTQTVA